MVELFAYLHDSQRENDGHDPGHGARAAEYARHLAGTAFQVEPAELELLAEACRLHTDGLTAGDITVITCWDADRLDLGRVGILPHRSGLCTPAAQDPALIQWAYDRSLR